MCWKHWQSKAHLKWNEKLMARIELKIAELFVDAQRYLVFVVSLFCTLLNCLFTLFICGTSVYLMRLYQWFLVWYVININIKSILILASFCLWGNLLPLAMYSRSIQSLLLVMRKTFQTIVVKRQHKMSFDRKANGTLNINRV